MLQQTQVVTVLRYYKNFLRQFPTVRHLASASPSSVLAAWAGMGYYNRARNLHRAAKIILDRFGGFFPEHFDDVLSLPGIGRYTAGAILSIAYGQRYPVVDGNVERVLSRVLALRGDVKSARHQKTLWSLAEQLVPPSVPSDFNQGLMELGATVCLPRQPQCGRCPVQFVCRGRLLGLESRLPQIRWPVASQKIHRAVAVIRDGQKKVLLLQRRDESLMRDFWEFPQTDLSKHLWTSARNFRQWGAHIQTILHHRFGFNFTVRRLLCSFRHSITFRQIHVVAFELQMKGFSAKSGVEDTSRRWVPIRSLRNFLFDSASLKILAALRNR